MLTTVLMTALPPAGAAPSPTSTSPTSTSPTSTSPTSTPAATPATPGTNADGSVSWGVAPADTEIGKNRAHFAYALNPGATLRDALAIVNHTQAPITLKTYGSDGFTASSGAMDLIPATQKSTDVGAWITLDVTSVTLAAGGSTVVPFTLRVPANATPGDHSGGVVTSLVGVAASGAVGVDRRLGARMYLRVGGALNPALAVQNLAVTHDDSLNPFGGGSVTATYTVKNVGNVRLQARQSIRVSGPFGLFAHTVKVADDLPELLPGNSLSRTATAHGVWPLFHVTTTIELTPEVSTDQPPIATHDASAARSYWTVPWGQLLVMLVLGALGVGYWLLRRRRQSKVDRAIADAVSQALQKAPEPSA